MSRVSHDNMSLREKLSAEDVNLNDYRSELLDSIDFEAIEDEDLESYDHGVTVGQIDGKSTGYTEGLLEGRESGWTSGYEDAVYMFNHDFKNYVDVDVDYLLENSRPCD